MNSFVKFLFFNILITLLLIIIFDVTTFNFLPSQYVSKFVAYRQKLPPDVGGLDRFPNGYFIEHEERGFDIGKNKNGHHWVDGVTYPIWSNSLGCFDNEHAAYNNYVYFAGDSFTWGYTPFNNNYGTIIERITGTEIFKCGVTHTGQIHQFSKFVELVRDIGKPPKAVFVFYHSNDIANDYAHPHTTVIQGWLIDSAYLDKNSEIIRISRQELERKVTDKLYRLKNIGWLTRAKRFLKFYSLTANILNNLKNYVAPMAGISIPRNIGSLPKEKNGKYWYLDNPKAQRNKKALLAFKRFSIENNIELSVVLIPQKNKAIDTNWYEEVREFLRQNKISYVDLTFKFREKKISSKKMYWVHNGHLNPIGNKIVAEILINEFPHIFRFR